MKRIFIINFLLAISTTIGMTIIPFIITDSLGLSLLMLGLIEGVSEFLSNAFRLTNGVLFDKIKNKRLIFISSTGIALLSKSMLLLPSSLGVLLSKVLERIANGTFASPRDAYVAANAKNKGTALGFLNASKSLGCILGPCIVSVSTLYFGNLKDHLHFFVLLCCSLALPAFILSFTLYIRHVEEKPFSFREFNAIQKKIAPILLIAFLFFLGRFNDGLIMIFLKKYHFPEWYYLATIGIFNTIMLIASPIIGSQIDKGQIIKLLYFSCASLVVFNLFFHGISLFEVSIIGWGLSILGLISWGIQRASAQIVFSSFIFKIVNKDSYGTAIGIYYIFSGIASLLAAFICGYIANINILGIFTCSGFFAFAALVTGIFWFEKKKKAIAEPQPI